MNSITRKLRDLYHLLPIWVQGALFSCYANVSRLRKKKLINSSPEYSISFLEINNLGDMINELKSRGAVISGENILAGMDCGKKLILAVSHELTMTGAPIVLQNMAEVLLSIGYQIVIISPCDGRNYMKEALSKGVPVVYYPDLFSSDFVLKTRGMYSKVIANTIMSYPVVNSFLGKETEVIWWIHDNPGVYRGFIARELPRKLTDNIKVYTVGRYAEKILRSRFPQYKTNQLLYYSPDLCTAEKKKSDFYNKIDTNKKIFAIIGVLCWNKGTDIAVKAIEMLPDVMRKKSLFVFVGRALGDERNKKLARRVLNLAGKYPDNVIVTGELSVSQVYKLYEKIDYLICPSREDCMPVVVSEAMSLGKPVICSINTGSAEIIRRFQAGYIYKYNNSSRLASLIVKAFYMKNEEYRMLSRGARRAYKAVFSRDVFKKGMRNIFK